MRNRTLRYVVYFLYLFFAGDAHSHGHQYRNLLSRLGLGTHSSKPVVVVLNVGDKHKRSDFNDLFNTEGDDGLLEEDDGDDNNKPAKYYHDRSSSSSLDEDDAYFLRGQRKKSTEETSSSSSSDGSLEDRLDDKTKDALRTALRARCQKVEKCVRKCPPQKPICPSNCQQRYDDMNLCPPPPPPDPCSKKPKCGKTLPPSWRF